MRLPLFTTIAAGTFLASIITFATADGGGLGSLSPTQQCLLTCSLTAVNASGCDIENTPCICESSVYATNVTQCAESTCGVSASTVGDFLSTDCADVLSSAAGSSSTRSGAAAPSASSFYLPFPTGSGSSATGSSNSASSNSNSNIPSNSAAGSSNSASNSNSNTPSNSAAASSETGTPVPNTNSAEAGGVRVRVAAASAVGLMICALLV